MMLTLIVQQAPCPTTIHIAKVTIGIRCAAHGASDNPIAGTQVLVTSKARLGRCLSGAAKTRHVTGQNLQRVHNGQLSASIRSTQAAGTAIICDDTSFNHRTCIAQRRILNREAALLIRRLRSP